MDGGDYLKREEKQGEPRRKREGRRRGRQRKERNTRIGKNKDQIGKRNKGKRGGK
ncbi:hypothetical protein L3K57_15575 (plasmid) [Enterococcus faecium]|uniref:hypothetical protein n=1 Tax=Enterococcus faecium TaxID=1352 RepID=UPI001F2365AB|nr:hypothetical protein [Enterococcus faecium]UJV65224.1 hypothetical protein L3K57_15575 [Enterococcus faecium]